LRAFAIAASASARVRVISPASAATRRRLPASTGPGFTGRPKCRAIAVCFGFLIILGLNFGIAARPTRLLRAMFSDKYLKNWYLLPVRHVGARATSCLLERLTHATRVLPLRMREPKRRYTRQNRLWRIPGTRHTSGLHNECANFALAHSYAPIIDRVIEALNW